MEAVLLGTLGSGNEEGLSAVYSAVDVHGSGFNAGFFREDADLAVLVLTDENDYSPISSTDFAAWFSALKAGGERVSFHSLATPNPAVCGVEWSQKYEEVAVTTGGLVRSICVAFSPSTNAFANDVIPMLRDYTVALGNEPDASSLEVEATLPDGTVLLVDAGDYDLDPLDPAITFTGNATGWLPVSGTEILVRYAVTF